MGVVREKYYRNQVNTSLQKMPRNITPGRLVKYNFQKYIHTGLTLDISNVQSLLPASPTGKKSDANEFRKVIIDGGVPKLSDKSYFLARKFGSKALRFYLNEAKNNSTIGVVIKGTKIRRNLSEKERKAIARLPKFTMYQQKFVATLKNKEIEVRKDMTQELAYLNELEKTNGRSSEITKKQPAKIAKDINQSKKGGKKPLTKVTYTNRTLAPSRSREATKPYFLQRYRYKTPSGEWININRSYKLDIVPNSIDFSQLSSTWSEIDRAGDYSLVDWSRNNLLKVSFRFLVAANNVTSNGLHDTFNGLQISIDDELQVLRGLAGTKAPVQLVNFTDYMTNTYRFPFVSKKEGIYFVINDMTISTTRFVVDESVSNRDGSIKKVAAAEVTVTLTEYPKQARIPIIPLPGLIAQQPEEKKEVSPPPDNGGRFVLFEELVAGGVPVGSEINWEELYSAAYPPKP